MYWDRCYILFFKIELLINQDDSYIKLYKIIITLIMATTLDYYVIIVKVLKEKDKIYYIICFYS